MLNGVKNTVMKYLGGAEETLPEGPAQRQRPVDGSSKVDHGSRLWKKVKSKERKKGFVTVYAPHLGKAVIDREYQIRLSKHNSIRMKNQEVDYEVTHYEGGFRSEVTAISIVHRTVIDSSVQLRPWHEDVFLSKAAIAEYEESRTFTVFTINEDSFQVQSNRWGQVTITSNKFKDFDLVLIGDRIKLSFTDADGPPVSDENMVKAEWSQKGSIQARVDEYHGFKHVSDVLCRDDFHRHAETKVGKIVKSLQEGDDCTVQWVASLTDGIEAYKNVSKRFKKRALSINVLKRSCLQSSWTKAVDADRLDAYAQSKEAFCSTKRNVRVGEDGDIDFGNVKVGEVTDKLVSIFNGNGSELILRKIDFKFEGIQTVCNFSVHSASLNAEHVAIFLPHERRSVSIECVPKLASKVTVIAAFSFELLNSSSTFTIGKIIRVEVRSASVHTEFTNALQLSQFLSDPEAKSRRCREIATEDRHVNFVPLGKELKQKPPFFKSRPGPLPSHDIPDDYFEIYQCAIVDRRIAAKKIGGLHHKDTWDQSNADYYTDRMKVALWFEELERRQMRKSLDLHGVYLSLHDRNQSTSLSFQPPMCYIDDPIINVGDIIVITPIATCKLSENDSNSNDSFDYVHPRFVSKTKAYKSFIDRIEDGRIFMRIAKEDLDERDWCKTKVDISFHTSRMQYIRMHQALALANSKEWLHPPNTRNSVKTVLVKFTEPESEARFERTGDRFCSTLPSASSVDYTSSCAASARTELTAREASCFKIEPIVEHKAASSYQLQWYNPALNKEQKAAVKTVLRAQFRPYPHIIYGPPGTGKTVTLVEAITQVFHAVPHSKILITATSNAAADVLAERLVDGNVISLEQILRFNAFYRNLRSPIPTKLKPISLSDVDLEKSLLNKRIVICTLSTAGQYFHLNEETPNFFSHVFIDEAGYASEVETLIGCVLASGKGESKIILAGDPRQLGPVVFCKMKIAVDSLERSFMLRLMTSSDLYRQRESADSDGNDSGQDDPDTLRTEFNPTYVSLLTKSYRLPKGLVEVPSELFYYNQLEAVHKEDCNLLVSITFLPRTFPLLFLALRNESERPMSSTSWVNPAQSEVCVDYVIKLRTCGVSPSDIAILALYRSQVEFTKKELRKSFTNQELPVVATVHEFQGNERKVIILSTVVSNIKTSANNRSFLSSQLIFNVAITRAKGLLLVIGDPEVLKHHKHWKRLMKYSLSCGVFQGCNVPDEVYVTEDSSALEKLATCFEEEDDSSDSDDSESSESNACGVSDW